MDVTGIGAVADLATSIVDKIWPDKSEQERAQIAAAVAVVQGQLDINNAEASNPSMWTSGWRPAVGWVCALALCYQFVARPLIQFGFSAAGVELQTMPGIDENLWELLAGMLGLGSLRSFEKVKRVAR